MKAVQLFLADSKKNTRSFQRSHDKNDKEINAAIYADLK